MSINFSGVVQSVQEKSFTCVQYGTNTIFSCIIPDFCPISVGDVIRGVGELTDEIIVFKRRPLVYIPTNDQSVKSAISTIGRFTPKDVDRYFDNFNEHSQKYFPGKGVSFFLDLMSMKNRYSSSPGIALHKYCKFLGHAMASSFLGSWYKQRVMRRFYVIGLTRGEVYGCLEHLQGIHWL